MPAYKLDFEDYAVGFIRRVQSLFPPFRESNPNFSKGFKGYQALIRVRSATQSVLSGYQKGKDDDPFVMLAAEIIGIRDEIDKLGYTGDGNIISLNAAEVYCLDEIVSALSSAAKKRRLPETEKLGEFLLRQKISPLRPY